MKTVKIINKENSINCPWMIHYTLLYKGREYTETLQGKHNNRYSINNIIEVDTFKDNNNKLNFIMKQIITA